jgi:hypothetical protein
VEVKVCQTERKENVRLLAGIRCSVGGLPDALLWCPSAGEPQHVSLKCETRESVEVRRMGTRHVADAQVVFVRQWGNEEEDAEAEGQLSTPHGVAVDSDHVYVCDSGNDRVQVFTKSDGALVRQLGSEGKADGEFKCPHGVAVDSGPRVCV